MLNNQNFFYAEVRNIIDPYRSGRVQIRIYGVHDNEQTIKDEHLPWALPLLPVTSASTAKMGVVPHGMIVGSRVFGCFVDEARQYPIVLGTFPRSAQLSPGQAEDGGQDTLKNGGIDNPVVNNN